MRHLGLLTTEWYPDEPGGGIARYCRTVAEGAVRLGHRVTVLAGTVRAERAAETGRLRVRPVPLAGLDAHATAEAFRDAVATLPDPPAVWEAGEFGGPAALLPPGTPLATRLHTPLALLLERNEGDWIYRDDALRCELELRQIRASAVLSSPSRWLAGEAIRLWRLDRPPVVVPNPVPPELFTPPAPRRDGPPRLLYLGRLEYRKGVLTLAEALREVLDHAEAEVTFAGRDTRWHGESVRARMLRLLGPHGPACQFTTAAPDTVAALLDAADLVVLPSRYENFSYAALETLARGRPVLATSGSGFPELLRHGVDGLLVPPDDAKTLAAALRHALDLPLLARLGARAAEGAARFAAARVLPDLLATLPWDAE